MPRQYPLIIHVPTGQVDRRFVVTNPEEEARAYYAILDLSYHRYPTAESLIAQSEAVMKYVQLDPAAALYLDDEEGLSELPERLQDTIRGILDSYRHRAAYEKQQLEEGLAFVDSVNHVLSLPVREAIKVPHESGVPLVEYLVMWRAVREYERVRIIKPDALPE